ncbi:cytochrome P450 [Auriscalpium vulgare]|uniref:Cytochrome P450 n=1 Tax=Auriscalpium vulgare TaxID=40419 RepID=A0ACB8S799_9AGAM|nr:cytochrome P450 [Auriscalpium vulgare]
MFDQSPPLSWLALALLAVLLLVALVRVATPPTFHGAPLPPGPTSSWFGGHLPTLYPWLTYADWRQKYGDVIYIYSLGNPIVILNSAKAAHDLLEERSASYSSRPRRPMTRELMGWDWLFSSMPYDSTWRRHRALFQKHFHTRASPRYQPIQIKETHTLLRNLAETPENFWHHVRRSSAAVVMMISYGHQVKDQGDEYVTIADQALTGLAAAGTFGTYLVDYLPILKYVPAWMPGASFRRVADHFRKPTREMVELPFAMVREQLASGTATPSLAANEIEEWHRTGGNPSDISVIKNVSAISFAAGADTTVSAILAFFLAMTVHPEIQREAQLQIDSVTGGHRLPLFSDRQSLPLIDSLVWECLRWNPVTPLGLPHLTTQDDVYEGRWIPKGTTVLPNIWSILHDDSVYPSPLTFDPHRFDDEEENQKQAINDLPGPAFGFGRRVCPGRYLAIDSIWITIASVLAVYDIKKTVDDNGETIEPDIEFTSSFLSRPKPFQNSIKPRSEAALRLIIQSKEEGL